MRAVSLTMHTLGYSQVFTYNTPVQSARYIGLYQINLNFGFATNNTNPVMNKVLLGTYIGEYK
jgi:hypothetical protein